MSDNVRWGTKGLSQGYRYDATIVSMEWVENNYGRKQLNIILEGKGGVQRTLFLPYSNALDSKWGVFQKGLENSGVPVDLNTMENPEKWLEGKTFTFEQYRKLVRVNDSETGEMVEKEIQFTKPVKYINDGGDTGEESHKKATAKPSSTANKPLRKLEDRFLDALQDNDRSVETLPELLGCEFGEVIDLMNRFESEGKIEVLKGGIIHLLPSSTQ